MTRTPPAAAAHGEVAGEAPRLPALLLAVYFLLSGMTRVVHLGGPAGAEYQLRWGIWLSDAVLAAIVISQAPACRLLWTARSRHRCALAAVVLGVSLLPALAVHPSARGVAAVSRWVGVAMVVFAIGRLAGAARDLVLTTFAGVTALQVAVALAQRASDAPLGLGLLGEPSDVYEIGGRYASTGLTLHPYILAAWCALAGAVLVAAVSRARPAPTALVVAAALPFIGVGLTMSRAGALAVIGVLACLALASLRRPGLRLVLAGAVLASALGVALDLSGWVARASGTVSRGGSAVTVTSGRTELLDQAWHLWKESPILGVGPGRYVEALAQRPEIEQLSAQRPSRPVHLVPFLVLVEGGLVSLPALGLLAWAAATQARRSGAVGAGVTVAVAPFLLLDHLHWSYPQGLMLTAIWLGVLDCLGGTGSLEERVQNGPLVPS